MKKRWSISDDDGASWLPASPVNGAKHRITQEQNLDSGLIAFRKKLTGGLLFMGSDYAYLRAIADDPEQRCDELLVRLEFQCSGTWQEYYRGKFSAGACKWDLGGCEVEVNPVTVDRYTCLLEQSRVKRNILQVAPVDATALNLPNLEYGVCFSIGLTFVGCDDFYDGFGYINEWLPGHSQAESAGDDAYQLNIFWRERQTTECVGGVAVPPPGSGWVLLSDDCATTGQATYIRQTPASWVFGDAVAGTIVDGNPVPPNEDCLWQYVGSIDETLIDPFDLTLGVVPFFICLTEAEGTELNRSRTVQDVVEYFLEQSGCDLLGARSDFFEWDPPGDAAGFALGTNYVTQEASTTNHLLILQKSDVIVPVTTTPATIGEMTLAEMMEALRVMFRCYWDIDDDGYLRIEHWSYWTYALGLDLPAMHGANVNEPLAYESASITVPRIERASWMEAQGRDFIGKDITYSGPCVNTEDPMEWSPGKITTDITFILNDPDEISKDGFVLMACAVSGSGYACLVSSGAITGNYITNAPLSWANLQRDFWTWDRFLPVGTMNGAQVSFDGYLPNIEQEEVRLTLCCELIDFDPNDRVVSHLSERLGVESAFVKTAEHDIAADRTTIKLRYNY